MFNTENNSMNFESELAVIRDNARKDIEEGVITSGYDGNKEEIIKFLNDSLATEIVCALRYKRHYYTASVQDGLKSEAIVNEFNIHAQEEMQHADMIAERIAQLGGEPDFSPDSLTSRSHADYNQSLSLDEMLKENLIAERIAVDTYRALIKKIGDTDPTTRRLFESILEDEEEHADELADWVKAI